MKNIFIITIVLVSMSCSGHRKLPKDSIIYKNNHYYKKDTEQLFNGKIVYYYPSGTIELIRTIYKGKTNGKSKLYFENGNKSMVMREDADFHPYGKIKKWDENGKLCFNGKYVDGLLYLKGCKTPFSGTIISTFSNGNIRQIDPFLNGEWHGEQIFYHEDGTLKHKAIFEEGHIIQCINCGNKN